MLRGTCNRVGFEALPIGGVFYAFLICCHIGQAVTLRAVIAGLIAVPAGLFTIGLLHMDIGNYEGGLALNEPYSVCFCRISVSGGQEVQAGKLNS